MLRLPPGLALGWLALSVMLDIGFLRAQDGAGYDPAAQQYHAPDLSLAGGKDSSEVDAALALLWTGPPGPAISQLDKLATQGDVKAALFLGDIYRKKSALPIERQSQRALFYYGLASRQGSGEASELIAEMLEHQEALPPDRRDAASWRALAVHQGWVQQELVISCLDWIHGPEQLHCEPMDTSADTNPPMANGCPSAADMKRLRAQGLTGSLRQDAAHGQKSDGLSAKAILIMDRPVLSEQDLKQPYAASVIYLQNANGRWQMIPANAPLLDRYIVLKSDGGGPGRTGVLAQNPDGSASGGACGLQRNASH